LTGEPIGDYELENSRIQNSESRSKNPEFRIEEKHLLVLNSDF
jgi:hypothetical protein